MWEQIQPYLVYVLIAAAALAALRLFTRPWKLVVKLALNTALGFAGLFVFNLLGEMIGLQLGLNLINAAVVGVLGLPGLTLLLLVRWLLAV